MSNQTFHSGFINASPDKSIPTHSDIDHLFRDEWAATQYLVDNLVVAWPTACALCKGPVSPVTPYDPVQHDVVDARGKKRPVPKNCFLARCRKRQCTEGHPRWTESIWKGTIFDGSRKKKSEVLQFFYTFLIGLSHEQLPSHLGWSDQTVTDWTNYCRQMFHMVVSRAYSLGGDGIIVEIHEESKLGKIRVFCGTELIWNEEKNCYKSGNIFLEVVDKRDAESMLIPLIKQYIRPGSIIYSGCWRAYGGIPSLEGYDFRQGTACHDRHFKGRWARIKAAIPFPCRGNNLLTIQEYLSEYVWRHRNKGRIWNAFLECLAQIRYGGEQLEHYEEGESFDRPIVID